MSIALYRRYRPQRFADVIGQEHVTEPLMRALANGRVGHAYLFSGPRGCGKTTSARILARCLNCERGPTPQPCGQCPSCEALARGGAGTVDVIEIDAASHGGVEDARDLREKASYGPAQARYKVYIIDEAHMVTPQGFNALLKIVEEPPEHVKFVFATTEPDKVIGTIRSRTHHYPFRLVPPSRVQEYLAQLCEQENVPVEPGVLSFIVRAAGGSVRDALSLLDQLMAGSTVQGLSYAEAAALLGFTEGELLDGVVDAFAAGDGAAVFRQIDRVIETGHDPRRFIEDLLERFRDLIVVAAVGEGAGAVLRGVPEDQLDRMRHQAAAFGPGQLSHAADTVNAGLTELTGATAPRMQLELICARLLLPGIAGERGYAARLDRLERRLDVAGAVRSPDPNLAPDPPVPAATAPATAPATGPAVVDTADSPPARSAGRSVDSSPAEDAETPQRCSGPPPDALTASPPPTSPVQGSPRGMDTEAIRRSWPDVLGRVRGIRRVTWAFLSEHAQVLDYDGQRLLLGISTRQLAVTFRGGMHAEVVRQALVESLGVDTRVEGIPLDEREAPADRGPSTIRSPSAAPGEAAHTAPTASSGPPAGQVAAGGPRGRGRARGSAARTAEGGAAPPGRGAARRSAAASSPPPSPQQTSPPSSSRQLSSAPVPAGSDEAGWDQVEPPDPDLQPPDPLTDDEPGPPPAMAADFAPGSAPDDAIASEDDEDVDGGDQVGEPVIANVLGGTVIAQSPE